MRNTFVYAYNTASGGARELSEALGCRRIRHEGSRYRPRPQHTVINWGSANPQPHFAGPRVLNRPELVARAANKLAFLRHCSGSNARTPEWTDSAIVARQWIDSGSIVVARRVLNGHSGQGIHILELGLDFVEAPLYTKYVRKEAEYRVHCAFGRVIDLQRKIKRPDFIGEPNWRVRNHQNGFIYVRNGVQAHEDVTTQALAAFEASGLDFGAVDVIFNGRTQQAYVLEINTAPGLQGQTVQSYANAFRAALGG